MTRTSLVALGVAAGALVAAPLSAQDRLYRSAYHDYRVVTVADGLVHPWSIAWLPGGDMLITERPGRLRIVRDGTLLPTPVDGVPEVLAQGQGGLLEVAPHPDFASNRLLYLTYSKPLPDGSGATTAVARGRFENDRLNGVEDLFVADSRGNGHYGSRIAFDGNGYLYFSVGDRQVPSTGDLEAHPAQDLSNHHGTINRIHDDGRVPSDNPFVDRPDARPEIWSYGHRNPQGLIVDPETGTVWATEHGPQGGDELNLIRRGGNYGWPVVGYGVNYRTGLNIHEGTTREGWESPVDVWIPSIGTSGLMLYTGDRFPGWRGNLFVGGLSGQQVARVTVQDGQVTGEETLVRGIGRVRDVRQGPDGLIYIAIDDRDGGPTAVVRLEPAGG
ncbi:MAG TPA: PQQ-dependent sugar dehydrogenase [Longimicrobiales bacterium]|nr:PQQ-dependent sugar dehydrogenase [Longimicrobiales bacterium]